MTDILTALRQILGEANFQLVDGTWDYGAMIEYFVGALILCIVVSSVFKFLFKLVK